MNPQAGGGYWSYPPETFDEIDLRKVSLEAVCLQKIFTMVF